MSRSLTVGVPWRVILVFAVPLLIGNVVQQAYQLTDTLVVGRSLGVDALASVGATGSLIFLLLGFAWGVTTGFAIPTAQAYGAGDAAGVRRSVAAGTLLTAATSVVITAAAIPLARPALEAMNTPTHVLPDAQTFAVISFAGSATIMFFNYFSAIIRAIGDSRTPLVFLTISCVLNIVLVVTLVSGLGYGVGAAALATVISQGTSVTLCLWYIRRSLPTLHVRREDWRAVDLGRHLRIGLPMGFQTSIIAIGTLAVQIRVNSFGADAMASYTTAARIDGLAIALMGSLGLAMSMFVAQNYGAGHLDRIIAGTRQALVITVAGSATIGVAYVLGGRALARLFVGAEEVAVIEMAGTFLTIHGATYACLGVLFVFRGALQGLGQTLVPTITGIIELVMRVGAAIVLGAAFGFTGVVWGNPLAWLGAVVVLAPAYYLTRRGLLDQIARRDNAPPTCPAVAAPPTDVDPIDVLRAGPKTPEDRREPARTS